MSLGHCQHSSISLRKRRLRRSSQQERRNIIGMLCHKSRGNGLFSEARVSSASSRSSSIKTEKTSLRFRNKKVTDDLVASESDEG